MDLQNIGKQMVLIGAVKAGMEIVRQNQGGHLPDDPEIKDDKTLVTAIDRRVEETLVTTLKHNFPEMQIVGEEGTKFGDGEFVALIDPLDGTRAFSCGMASSTVIIGIYNVTLSRLVGCVIGEAATGRIWSAFGDSPTRLLYQGEISVWQGEMSDQATILLDVSHGFQRKGRQILSDTQVARLFATLGNRSKLFLPGSNGLMQALVANGGQKMVGSITTAIGGPWDVCGVKLVLNAGGAARAFSVINDFPDIHVSRVLEERDPLDVFSYDMLITGNSQETVDTLSKILEDLD